ncbi:SGNH/GDSL hydrolase family protein [Halalkalibacter sp. AB-rgal2]|uniref:SGNH/GDSL hydrolase family protein n=1 Tax=Halalkalibacter sp. AB-rgal2 TaxID=3242695 RepID=UPI00359CCA23
MKTTLFISTIVLAIILIIGGHYYYQQKLQTIADDANQTDVDVNEEIRDNEQPSNEDEALDNDDSSEDSSKQLTPTSASGMLSEWIEQYGEDGTLKIAVLGSTSITLDNTEASWPNLLASSLQGHAEDVQITMDIVDVDRLNTFEVAESDHIDAVMNLQPEVLLIEPFLLNDNGLLMKEDSIEMLERILSSLEVGLEETEIILMPGNPLYGAEYYLQQNEALEQFAAQEGYLFVDYWFAWPATDDPDLQNYIDSARPNEQGHQVWAEALYELLTN